MKTKPIKREGKKLKLLEREFHTYGSVDEFLVAQSKFNKQIVEILDYLLERIK